MFATLRKAFGAPALPASVTRLPAPVQRQVGAAARIAGLDLNRSDQCTFAVVLAVVALRLGIDLTTDPRAAAKLATALAVLQQLANNGTDLQSPGVLDALARALRQC